MKILAIDSSGLVASAAIVDETQTIAEYTLNYKKTHSETLVPMIDEIKKMTELDLSCIDMIAVAKGPGSFTGLRIGSATAKGLSFSLNIPIVEVPTVDALSCNAWGSKYVICPIMDARREQVYTGIYEFIDGRHHVIMQQRALSVAGLCKRLDETGREVLFLGDGVPVYKDLIDKNLRTLHVYAPLNMNRQRASSVGMLALEYIKEGRGIVTGSNHKPEYLRMSQAEREKFGKTIFVRDMTKDDLEAVSDIEQKCFSMPWKPDDFAEMIERDNMTYVVLCDGDKIIGGAGLRRIVDTGEITNVAVLENYRGRDLSKLLLLYLLKKGKELGCDAFTLEVRASNEPAIRLYEAAGFIEEGVRPDFYEKPKEDAKIFWLR